MVALSDMTRSTRTKSVKLQAIAWIVVSGILSVPPRDWNAHAGGRSITFSSCPWSEVMRLLHTSIDDLSKKKKKTASRRGSLQGSFAWVQTSTLTRISSELSGTEGCNSWVPTQVGTFLGVVSGSWQVHLSVSVTRPILVLFSQSSRTIVQRSQPVIAANVRHVVPAVASDCVERSVPECDTEVSVTLLENALE